VGRRPYVVTKYDAATGDATFERNSKWWGKTGKLDKRLLVGLESQAAVNAFRNGELDYASTGDADGLKQISGVSGTEIRRGGSPFEYFLFLNAKAPLLSDIAVRKAILESVDRQQIAAINLQDWITASPARLRDPLLLPEGYHDNVSDVINMTPIPPRRSSTPPVGRSQ